MVAGIKGVTFIKGSSDLVAASSSTAAEVLIVSIAKRSVQRIVKVGHKIESLCVLSESALLVADGRLGVLWHVDLSTEPATKLQATDDLKDFRITSVAAMGEAAVFVAGAARGCKTACCVRRVDLGKRTIQSETLLEAPMVRALCVDAERLLVGAIDVANEDAENGTTTIYAWCAADDFSARKSLGSIDVFVHAIARHPHYDDLFVLLARHGAASFFECPIRVVRFMGSAEALEVMPAKCAILQTLPVSHDGMINNYTRHTFAASIFGARAGREHAMAISPEGKVVTGSVDNSTKGILQVWQLDLLSNSKNAADESGNLTSSNVSYNDTNTRPIADCSFVPYLPFRFS